MFIYEFTLNDNTGATEAEIIKMVKEDLETEAELREWPSGWVLHQTSRPYKYQDGTIEYFFAVEI